jgi:hypothetical protein
MVTLGTSTKSEASQPENNKPEVYKLTEKCFQMIKFVTNLEARVPHEIAMAKTSQQCFFFKINLVNFQNIDLFIFWKKWDSGVKAKTTLL